MKLSFLLELLLILIIIAFAASMPVDKDAENLQEVKKVSNAVNKRQSNTVIKSTVAPSPTPSVEDDDDDDDDIFDLVDDDDDEDESTNVKKDPETQSSPENENSESDDDDDVFGITDDDEAEKDTPSEEDEFDGSELILFGEDLFQAVFEDDDEDSQKKKPIATIANITSSIVSLQNQPQTASSAALNAKPEQKPSSTNPFHVKTNQTEKIHQQHSNKKEKRPIKPAAAQLYLQHTPALLELAQQTTMVHDMSTIANAINSEKHSEFQLSTRQPYSDVEAEIYPTPHELTSSRPTILYELNDDETRYEENEANIDEDVGDNEEVIIVPDENDHIDDNDDESDDDQNEILSKPNENEKLTENEKITQYHHNDVKNPSSLPIIDDSENVIPQNDKLSLNSGPVMSEQHHLHQEIQLQDQQLQLQEQLQQQQQLQQQSELTQKLDPTKKPNKEEDEGLLDLVESIIFDEDEDESDSKPVKSEQNDKDKNETPENDDEDDEDESEDSESDDEEEEEEDSENKPSSTVTPTSSILNDNKDVKKKKKKQSSLIDVLGETLGLTRVLKPENIKIK